MQPLGKGGKSLNISSRSHDKDGRMPIYCKKKLQKSSQESLNSWQRQIWSLRLLNGKKLKLHFLMAVVLCNNLGTLANGHLSVVCQHFQRASPLKPLGQVHFNFISNLLAKGERKFIYSV